MAQVATSIVGITRDDVISILHQAGLPIDEYVIERWIAEYSQWLEPRSALGYLKLRHVSHPLDKRLQKNIRRRGRDMVIAKNGG